MNARDEYKLIERMTAGDFDPDQPRDEEGKWTDTGAGGSGGSKREFGEWIETKPGTRVRYYYGKNKAGKTQGYKDIETREGGRRTIEISNEEVEWGNSGNKQSESKGSYKPGQHKDDDTGVEFEVNEQGNRWVSKFKTDQVQADISRKDGSTTFWTIRGGKRVEYKLSANEDPDENYGKIMKRLGVDPDDVFVKYS